MCDWGTTVQVRVTVPARLSHTGTERQKTVGVDACIAPLVRALNSEEGVETVASCCGHGKAHGRIVLADGRELLVVDRNETEETPDAVG